MFCMFTFRGCAGLEAFKREMQQTGEVNLKGHINMRGGRFVAKNFQVMLGKDPGDEKEVPRDEQKIGIRLQLVSEVADIDEKAIAAATASRPTETETSASTALVSRPVREWVKWNVLQRKNFAEFLL